MSESVANGGEEKKNNGMFCHAFVSVSVPVPPVPVPVLPVHVLVSV